ncbi:MAG: ATP-binding cassette domain-containing protein [Candidatus Sumerlaeia bacterium]|nr:ATP-binding cassette domain-containing protein [Candidatus Sumerlaeia bacterium]
MMIDVSNLTKLYGSTRAVDGISFQIDKGEVVGFLGPNGAGKSTTMKVLTCFIAPDGGTVKVAGHDVVDDSIGVRRSLGYLPENTPLYEEMGVVEFLRFVAGVRGVPSSKRKERLDHVIRSCGLAGVVAKTIGQLSRGYRQRVGLAQALIHDPDILILDEPTSALDPAQIVEIRDLIREIGKTKTVLLSTHIMQEVAATCSRAIIISRGKIVASGTPEELTGQRKGERRVRAEFRAEPKEVEAAARALPGALGAEAVAGNKGSAVLTATFKDGGGDPAEALYRLARDKDWALRELREDRATLEEVFIRVTKQL